MLSLFKLPSPETDFNTELEILTKKIMAILKYDIAKIFMYNDDKSNIIIKLNVSKDEENIIQGKDKLINICADTSKNIFKLLFQKKQVIICSYADADNIEENSYEPFVENIKNEIYIPLYGPNIIDEDVKVCLYLGSYDADKLVEREDLIKEEFVKKIEHIKEITYINYQNFYNRRSFLDVIHLMDDIVSTRDKFMANHHYNVANWSNMIAVELGFNAQQCYKLYIASIFHDIGKLYVKDSIVNKNGKLTDTEYNNMKKHCEYGFSIANKLLPYSDNIPEIIKCHHERYDGNGYPNGLIGEEIPFESRIIAIGDAVDAMLSYRVYKKPIQVEDIILEVTRNKGKQFDAEIADVMIKILSANKAENELILSKPIIMGTINILIKKENYIIRGTLIKGLQGYIFECYENSNSDAIKLNKIDAMYFYTENKNTIFEYNLKIKSINKNRIYISDLNPKITNEYFEILWELIGEFELCEEKKFDVNIVKISGDKLSFFTVNKLTDNNTDSTLYKFNVYFLDGTIMPITGVIVNKFCIGYKYFYVFKFVNLKEQQRDAIIKQIFGRQAELRFLSR